MFLGSESKHCLEVCVPQPEIEEAKNKHPETENQREMADDITCASPRLAAERLPSRCKLNQSACTTQAASNTTNVALARDQTLRTLF